MEIPLEIPLKIPLEIPLKMHHRRGELARSPALSAVGTFFLSGSPASGSFHARKRESEMARGLSAVESRAVGGLVRDGRVAVGLAWVS